MHGPERERHDERHDGRRDGGRNGRRNEASGPAPASEAVLLIQSIVDYAIFMLDPGGHVVSWNPGAERIKGYRAEDIIGRHFSVFYPPEDVAAGKPDRELELAVAEGRLEDEGWRVRKDGSWFWANVVITALVDDAGLLRGFGKVTRDMTERRAAELAIVEGRRLLAHLVEAQEVERRRIAWDVHDDSIQSMVAVGMRLRLLAGGLPEEHVAALRQLDEAVAGTISRLRNLVFRLRPPGIDREGLAAVLSGYLGEVVAGWGLKHSLRFDLEREPPTETATTIFRICQEALTNVHRHARATVAEISMSTVDNGTLVRVTDDGIGVGEPLERLASHEHFGVMEMRERAETAGGWLTIRSKPSLGTTVEFWVPSPRAAGPGTQQ
jgi:PAS domain S-box-containing protein